MSIQAVAFDFGGVISLPQDERSIQEMAEVAGIDTALMRRLYWEHRSAYDQGLVSGEEYFRNLLAEAGVFPDAPIIERLIQVDLQSWARINPETERLMRDIQKAGFKLGVLSNMVKPFIDWAREALPVLGLPDGAVYSCEVNAVKPERKIYEKLLAVLDCGADELVFFDDMPQNVEGAANLGILAFVWKGPESARKELEVLCAGRF